VIISDFILPFALKLSTACLDSQEAESTTKRDYSIFTYYLLEGLKGTDIDYVDKNGNVTTSFLGYYVYDKLIMNLNQKYQSKGQ
jgi:hypothetical protein